MFKVINKNTRTSFTTFSSVSITDFEQVNVSWETSQSAMRHWHLTKSSRWFVNWKLISETSWGDVRISLSLLIQRFNVFRLIDQTVPVLYTIMFMHLCLCIKSTFQILCSSIFALLNLSSYVLFSATKDIYAKKCINLFFEVSFLQVRSPRSFSMILYL